MACCRAAITSKIACRLLFSSSPWRILGAGCVVVVATSLLVPRDAVVVVALVVDAFCDVTAAAAAAADVFIAFRLPLVGALLCFCFVFSPS